MTPSRLLPALILAALVFTVSVADAQVIAESNPMAPFDRLVGGAWHMGETHQVFEWGPGKLALYGRSYRAGENGPMQVGGGMLFYHPGEDAIRGYISAIGMGIDLFDYTLRSADDDGLVFDLKTFGAMQGQFEEVWEFTDDDTFDWSLSQITDDGVVPMMTGTFVRKTE